MILLFYSNCTIVFMTFLTCTCSPNKMTYIFTSGNVPLFLSFFCNFLPVFSEGQQHLFIPHDPRCHGGILCSPFLCPSSNQSPTSHTSTYTTLHPYITYVSSNFFLKQSPNEWRTYKRSIQRIYYAFVPHLLNSKFVHSLDIIHGTRKYKY